MTSAKKRAANRANGLHLPAGRKKEGLRPASLNAMKHGLSLPVDEVGFGKDIFQIAELIRDECTDFSQAQEMARRIIDFERNEAFLRDHNDAHLDVQMKAWFLGPHCAKLHQLVRLHRDKKKVDLTFTTSNLQPKGQERTDEVKFIEDFMKLQENSFLSKFRHSKRLKDSAVRYQKRSLNQLIKGVSRIATGEGP
jgi:hypothetical protein